MIHKKQLINFINKYYLGGLNNSAKWRISDNTLTVYAGEQGKVCKIILKDFKFEDCILGVFDTDKLLRLINITEHELVLTPEKIKAIYLKLHVQDKNFDLTYSLADPLIFKKMSYVQDPDVNKAVIGFDNVFGLNNYDTIITPESSSLILSKIANSIESKSGVANLFTDAFVKSASTDIKLDMDKVNELPEKTKKEVFRAFTKATDPSKPFKIKEIFSAHRKFFIDFLQFNTQNDRTLFNAVEGKEVILIDDYKTSGTTIKEMLRQLADLGAAKVTVFVFIKLG